MRLTFDDLFIVYAASCPVSAGIGCSLPATLHMIRCDRRWMDYVSETWTDEASGLGCWSVDIALRKQKWSCCETNYWISLINFVLELIYNDVCNLWLTQVTPTENLCFAPGCSNVSSKGETGFAGIWNQIKLTMTMLDDHWWIHIFLSNLEKEICNSKFILQQSMCGGGGFNFLKEVSGF